MQTPMQELIRQVSKEFPSVAELAQKLLEKEKEQMIDIWLNCAETFDHDNYDEENERFIAIEYLENKYSYDK